MEAKIAVATVRGKAYYLLVNELQKKNATFLSITPNEPIPLEINVVITTEEEKQLIRHERILVYKEESDPEAVISNALHIIQGKEHYEKLVIGVDPGEVIGLAILADGKVIETENCYSVGETLKKIETILKNLENPFMTSISIKIGDGAPAYKERILQTLDDALPQGVRLESVHEAGTSRNLNGTKHRRGLTDMVSAVRIAGRNGHLLQRRKADEPNG